MNVSDADEFEMQKKKKLVPKWQIGLGVYLEKKVNKKLLKKAKKKKFGILSEGGPNQVLNRPISNSTKFERFQIPAALLMQKVEPEIFMVSDEKTTMNSVDKVNDTTIVSHLGDFKDGFALVDEDILDSSGDSYDVITVFDDWEIGFNDSSAVSLGKSMLGMWSILLVCTILIGCL
ncbi:uncharacterized protein LODBEIA_P45740 [Lodderomyces beijingensis]|uniref:Uncharacterized protein n=1 Tax=Lodderomyces beijingensis TaxID=1775926 RepID=A0ABP0ZVH6_9ASCO